MLGNLIPPPVELNRSQQTGWNCSGRTGQGAPDSQTSGITPPIVNHNPPTNSGDGHAPESPARHYSQGVDATNQPIFAPILSQESCPAFTAAMYSNWRREIKLWLSAQHGIPVTHILARIIAVLPLQCRIEAMNYMDSTETAIHTRSLDPIWTILDNRYGKTDAERSCSWLTAFAEFRRDSQENYKGFWTRLTRCATKLRALGMPLNDTVVFNKALAALRIL